MGYRAKNTDFNQLKDDDAQYFEDTQRPGSFRIKGIRQKRTELNLKSGKMIEIFLHTTQSYKAFSQYL